MKKEEESVGLSLVDVLVLSEKNATPVLHRKSLAFQKGDFYCVLDYEADILTMYPIARLVKVSVMQPKMESKE